MPLFFLFVIVKFGFCQVLPEAPKPQKLVNDFAGLLNSQEKDNLEKKLVLFDDSTSNQIAIVTVNSLSGDEISDFTIKLFQKWKIGSAKNNNGVLILISKPDRKAFISVGNGLEPVITDALSRRIIEIDMIPNFKLGNYYKGLDLATTHLMQIAKGEFHIVKPQNSQTGKGFNLIFIVIIIIVLILLFTRGGGSQQIGRNGTGSPFWFLLGAMMNSGGGSSWGDRGGSSGEGGGFGGFGGGSTGGGGAGGSW